jgi:hypothetical protein
MQTLEVGEAKAIPPANNGFKIVKDGEVEIN